MIFFRRSHSRLFQCVQQLLCKTNNLYFKTFMKVRLKKQNVMPQILTTGKDSCSKLYLLRWKRLTVRSVAVEWSASSHCLSLSWEKQSAPHHLAVMFENTLQLQQTYWCDICGQKQWPFIFVIISTCESKVWHEKWSDISLHQKRFVLVIIIKVIIAVLHNFEVLFNFKTPHDGIS